MNKITFGCRCEEWTGVECNYTNAYILHHNSTASLKFLYEWTHMEEEGSLPELILSLDYYDANYIVDLLSERGDRRESLTDQEERAINNCKS